MGSKTLASEILYRLEDYLKLEESSKTRNEYYEGRIVTMPETSRSHSRITGNLRHIFSTHIRATELEVFAINMKLKGGCNVFYPDVMVVCEETSPNEYYSQSPVLIVEVISKTTRRIDQTTKRQAYFNIPSLKEYVLIEQEFVDVEICRRSNGWISKHFFMGDTAYFESIDLYIRVDEIYARVENEDVKTYLEQQRLAAEQNPITNL